MNRMLLGVLASSVLLASCGGSQTTMTFDGSNLQGGDSFKVSFETSAGITETAWIGIVPAGAAEAEAEADKVDLDYAYVEGKEEGEVTLDVPLSGGAFEVRFYSSDDPKLGQLLAAQTFSASEAEATEIPGDLVELRLEKEVFAPGEMIKVDILLPEAPIPGLDATGWIGVVPSNIEHGSEELNDQHDTTFERLATPRSSALELQAPSTPGSYDIRVHTSDTNGVEVGFITFTVEGEAIEATDTMSDTSEASEAEEALEDGAIDEADLDIMEDPSNENN